MSLSTWSERVAGNKHAGSDAVAAQSAERFAWSHPGPLTIALIAICGVAAALTLPSAPFPLALSLRLEVWGAKVNENIRVGHEWWRLLSSTFLHASWRHLLLNAYALFVVGSVVERSYGRARLLTIYLASALAGGVASLTFVNSPSVGASGAIFGLVGAALLVLWRGRQGMRSLVSERALFGLGVWAAASLLEGFTGSGVDNAAHVGGFIAGLIVAACLPEGRIARTTASLGVVALGWSLGMATRSIIRTQPAERSFERGMVALNNDKDTATFDASMVAAGKYPPALSMLAARYLATGRDTAVIRLIDPAFTMTCAGSWCDNLRIQRAEAFMGLGRDNEGLFALAQASNVQDPDLRRYVVRQRATALHRLHRDMEAVALADSAVEWKDEKDARRMQSVRAGALSALGRHADAARQYAATAATGDPAARAGAWLSARVEYQLAGDSLAAATSLIHAVEEGRRAVDSTRGRDARTLRLFATALRIQRRCDDAAATFARASMLQPLKHREGQTERGGAIRIWTESPPNEGAVVILAHNVSDQRMIMSKMRLVECNNVREVCNVAFDPCMELASGAIGEVWIYNLDLMAPMSFRPEPTW